MEVYSFFQNPQEWNITGRLVLILRSSQLWGHSHMAIASGLALVSLIPNKTQTGGTCQAVAAGRYIDSHSRHCGHERDRNARYGLQQAAARYLHSYDRPREEAGSKAIPDNQRIRQQTIASAPSILERTRNHTTDHWRPRTACAASPPSRWKVISVRPRWLARLEVLKGG
jgi:hypothetical protein